VQPSETILAQDCSTAIATEAAVSKLLPIQDGPDLWTSIEQASRSSSGTGSGASAPG
jgi:hypothetical protein